MRWIVLLVAVLLSTSVAHAHKKYADAEGKPCAYCHVSAQGSGPRTYRGVFYATHNRSFAGFDDAAEAKKVGVPIGPEAEPAPRSLVASKSAVVDGSLLPSFAQGEWRVDLYGGTAVKSIEADGTLSVKITSGGKETWNVGLSQPLAGPSALREGKEYTLRFRARAEGGAKQMVVLPQQDGEPYANLGLSETVALTGEWQSFHFVFTGANLKGNPPAGMHFMLGAQTGLVQIADVSLVVGSLPPPRPRPTPGPDPRTVVDFATASYEGIDFVRLPAGTFRMGTTDAQRDALVAAKKWTGANANETPARQVTISKPFFLGKYEVTQAQWRDVMGNAPSAFKNRGDNPVEQITWEDAREFCARLGRLSADGTVYRLPTEAEWEYAARAGSDGIYGLAPDKTPITDADLGDFVWFTKNAQNQTHPVGQKKPSAWGLFDMSGNVWEWCEDAYLARFYALGPTTDPLCPTTPDRTEKILRGGCWFLDDRAARASLRGGNLPTFKSPYVGLRIVREIK